MSMWSDALTVLGLLLDVAGAMLLIGQDWQMTRRFAHSMTPTFRRLDNAIAALWISHRNIGPVDDGFRELVDLIIDQGLVSVSDGEIRCVIAYAPDTRFGGAEFSFERTDTNPPTQIPSPKINFEMAKRLRDQAMQRWFVQRGVAVLMFGFALQIVAALLPYVACFALIVMVWSVPFPVPVPVPSPVSGVCAVAIPPQLTALWGQSLLLPTYFYAAG